MTFPISKGLTIKSNSVSIKVLALGHLQLVNNEIANCKIDDSFANKLNTDN